MSEPLSEQGKRLRDSTQAFIDAGGDPATAEIREKVGIENGYKIGKIVDRIIEITDEGVITKELGLLSWGGLADNHHIMIHMRLK